MSNLQKEKKKLKRVLAQPYWYATHVLVYALQHMLALQSIKSGTDSNGLKIYQVKHTFADITLVL